MPLAYTPYNSMRTQIKPHKKRQLIISTPDSAGGTPDGTEGMGRIQASCLGAAYAPHKHDTYAIGVTLSGVRTFDYRGETRHSLSGQMVIIHPDERHDGRAGTDDGFSYRNIYVKPALIQEIVGGKPLPFFAEGVSSNEQLKKAVYPLLNDFSQPLDPLEYQSGLYDLAVALGNLSGSESAPKIGNQKASAIARAYIDDNLQEVFSLDDLAFVAGHDRWQLSRDFRALYGTSPYRYLILRRLDKAKAMLQTGVSLADVAIDCGFSDQSHFGRQFKKAFGLSPGAWMAAIAH